MTNRTDEEQEYTVTVHFVDADGFSVKEDNYAGDVINKIPGQIHQTVVGSGVYRHRKRPHSRRHYVGGQRPIKAAYRAVGSALSRFRWCPCLV